jgi:hypothetical protein
MGRESLIRIHNILLCLHGDTMQDSLKILETVNNFYTQSFSQLINITVAVLVFAGIIFPILITFYQKRLFKLEHEAIESSLTKKMKEELDNTVAKIELEYSEKEIEFELKISQIKEELYREVDRAKGGISHVQGCNDLEKGCYFTAFDSFVHAGTSYLRAKDNANLLRILNNISDSCLPRFSSKDFEDNEDVFSDLEKLMGELSEYNVEGVYMDPLRKLKRALSLCKKRMPENPNQSKDNKAIK